MRNGKPPTLANGWQWRKFGDCAQFINGRAYSQDELLDSGTPVLRIQNLNGGDRWYYSNLKLPDEKYCEAGDLLYAWSASFGPYRFSGPKSIFHYHIWRVIPGDELDKTFAFHLLEEITAEVKSAAHGVAMLHMTKGGIEGWPIPLPPLSEQRRIAQVLDRAEALRAKRRAALAQLDALTQSIFLDMFGDPATNPKGWPMSSLAEVCSIPGQYGSGVPAIEFSPSLPRYVRITDIDSDGNLTSDRVSPGGTSTDWSHLKLETGDVLFARSGATVGKTYKYSPAYGDCVFAGYLIRFRTIPTKLRPEVLFHFTRSEAYFRWVVARQRVVAQPNINAKQYGTELSIPIPPIPLQREFARRVTAVEALKSAQRASLAELDTLFASLQHRAFRGEL